MGMARKAKSAQTLDETGGVPAVAAHFLDIRIKLVDESGDGHSGAVAA